MNEFLIQLQAILDKEVSKGNINKSIERLQNQINKLKLQAEVDPKSILSIKKQLEKITNQPITLKNISMDTGELNIIGQQTGQKIGQSINQGLSNGLRNNDSILESFKRSLSNIGMETGTIDAVAERIKGLNVEIKSLNQSKNNKAILSVDISGIDKYGQAIKLTEQYNIETGKLIKSIDAVSSAQQKSAKNTDSFAKQQSRAVSDLTNQINQLNRATNDKNASRPITDSSHLDTLSSAYNNIIAAIEKMKTASNDNFVSEQNNVRTLISDYKSMVSEFRNAENAATQMKSMDISAGIEQAVQKLGKLKANSSGFEQMKQTISELEAEIAHVGDKSSLDNFTDKLRVAEAQLARVKAEVQSLSQANKIQFQVDTGGYDSKVESIVSRTMQWTDGNGNARISTDELRQSLERLNAASAEYASNKTEETQRRLIEADKELDKQLKTVTNSVRKMNAEFAKDSSITSLHNKIQSFYDNNTAAHRGWGTQLKQMLSETASGAQLTTQRVREIEQAFNGVATAARQAGKTGKSWFQSLKDAAKNFTYFASPTFITMKTISEVKQGVNAVKELDTALVDLKKTTTMTSNQLEDFYYDSNDVAKQMGVTTSEIINQASAWSRLGFSSAEAATKMAKYSSQFASISPGMDLDSATDGLVSMMKAYDIGNDNPDDVLDGIMSKINIIGNTAATSNAEIVNMLSKSSSAMAEANNTLEETIALETAAVEITRDDDSVGNAFKTVAMRIRGKQILPPYKENLYAMCLIIT